MVYLGTKLEKKMLHSKIITHLLTNLQVSATFGIFKTTKKHLNAWGVKGIRVSLQTNQQKSTTRDAELRHTRSTNCQLSGG